MKKLRPLINGQRVRIDNHIPGKPMIWDWPHGEKPDDVHLDKSKIGKIHGMDVKTRVTLNNNQGANEPKKCEREDKEWKKAYDQMMKEVHDTLLSNSEIKNQLVEDVNNAIREIGPRKANRAVRKALKRIAEHFDLPDELFLKFQEVKRGTVALFLDEEHIRLYYVGFGLDYAFYLGEGNGVAFSRRVRGWHKEIRPALPSPTPAKV